MEIDGIFDDSRLGLYNLRDDIGEKDNLADKMPGEAKKLLEMMKKWRTAIKAPIPEPNEASRGKIR